MPDTDLVDESTAELQMPPGAQARTFEHAMELWVRPEVERRRRLGLVEGDLELTAAQVIMREGEPLVVRLNEEIIAVARMKLAADVRAGDAVNLADVHEVHEILLTDGDPDAAHLTMINLDGGWTLAFDFRYNATKARRVTEMATEFLSTAERALGAGALRAAADAMFSAVELMARAELMLLPAEQRSKDGRFSHGYVAMVMNRRSRAGLMTSSKANADLLNRLATLRSRARYRLEPFEASDLPKLFAAARHWFDELAATLPERVAVDPVLLSRKPTPPPRT